MAEERVILADSDVQWRKTIKAIITKAGFSVVGEAEDGLNALKQVRSRQPDLLIIEAMGQGMSGLKVARLLYEDKLAPVVVFANLINNEILEKTKEAHAAALLVKTVDEVNLLAVIEIALTNYQELIRLENQVKELKETLETRKAIERAKGILMETIGLTEAEAFKRMQKQSMNKRISMRQLAEAIILTHNLRNTSS
ncbi:Fis family transcriptional regulator [Peptococcaceae bacterium SCADC1_2_3]|nr:Fis family transcriptional regulator [Peptococcaceae bacterium SCADC1_2_3]KFI37810.1 Fis family transcriptional regulator [Peptococcaceae bacterium SCADC1_2_3]